MSSAWGTASDCDMLLFIVDVHRQVIAIYQPEICKAVLPKLGHGACKCASCSERAVDCRVSFFVYLCRVVMQVSVSFGVFAQKCVTPLKHHLTATVYVEIAAVTSVEIILHAVDICWQVSFVDVLCPVICSCTQALLIHVHMPCLSQCLPCVLHD